MIRVFIKGTAESFSSPLPPREDTAGRQLSVIQEAAPHQTLNLLATWSWSFQHPEINEKNVRNKCLLFASRPAYGIFIIAFQQTKAPPEQSNNSHSLSYVPGTVLSFNSQGISVRQVLLLLTGTDEETEA